MNILKTQRCLNEKTQKTKYAYPSFHQLEHEDCLLNIDIGYYKFLDDPILTGEIIKDKYSNPIDKIDYYLMSYIHGEGTDPSGNPKEQNRRIFQCFINEELPEKERIQVDYSEADPFARAAQAMGVVKNRQLRTPANVLLRDFSAKKKIEEGRQKMRVFMEHPDYKILKETLPVLSKYPLLSQWICDAFVESFKQEEKEKQSRTGGPQGDSRSPDQGCGKILGSWKWPAGTVLFTGDGQSGSASATNNPHINSGVWRCTGPNTVEITWDNGKYTDTVRLSGDKLSATNQNGTKFSATRSSPQDNSPTGETCVWRDGGIHPSACVCTNATGVTYTAPHARCGH